MKKINLRMGNKSVFAEFPDETMLDEVLHTVEGLIHALGYCFDGHLEFVEPPDFENGAMDINWQAKIIKPKKKRKK